MTRSGITPIHAGKYSLRRTDAPLGERVGHNFSVFGAAKADMFSTGSAILLIEFKYSRTKA